MMAIEDSYGSTPTLAQLRAFLAVARAGSFSAAALDLGVSQASVSYAIEQAEARLEVKLFRRSSRGARLTNEGERLQPHVVRLLRSQEVLLQEAEALRGPVVGTVRIAAFPSVAQYILPLLMRRLREAHPGVTVAPVDIATSSSDVLDALNAGHAELGLVVARLGTAHIQWKVFEEPFVVVVPQSEYREGMTWEDLRDLPLIVYDKDWRDGCVLGMQFFLDRFGFGEAAYRVRETGTILGLVGEGLGFSVLPELTVGTLPAGVARVDLPVPRVRTVSVAVPPELLGAPLIRRVLAALKEVAPDSEVPPLAY